MSFVKLDTAILRSSLWVERDVRSLFVTALLMAEPFEVKEPLPQIEVRSLNKTGWTVPPGWYGLVKAAGVGIVREDGLEREAGLDVLETLGSPDPESRSQDFDGRRLVRVDGGYLALNYMKYRDFDHTAAERQQRLRDRRKAATSNALHSDVTRDVTLQSHIAESREQKAEAESVEGEGRNGSETASADRPDASELALLLTIAANKGMAENEALGGEFMPINAGRGDALEVVGVMARAGVVDWDTMARIVKTLAKGFKPKARGDSIKALTYFADRALVVYGQHVSKLATDAAPAIADIPIASGRQARATPEERAAKSHAGALSAGAAAGLPDDEPAE